MESYFYSFLQSYQIIFVRYMFTALLFFTILYFLLRKHWSFKKIQRRFPANKDYAREILYSVLSIVQFAIMGVIIFQSPFTVYSKIYYEFSAFPFWYYILSFPIMLFIHDTYFYWMHRTLHHPKIFKTAHLVHHKSTNPSPWAAYSFHPIEAFFEAAILPILAFTLPLHISTFGFFFLFQIIYNVYGHSGFELYPKGFHKHWLGRWINTSVHHNLHHKYFEDSYGLYFTFWDRIMGTMHPKYETAFDEVLDRKPGNTDKPENEMTPESQYKKEEMF